MASSVGSDLPDYPPPLKNKTKPANSIDLRQTAKAGRELFEGEGVHGGVLTCSELPTVLRKDGLGTLSETAWGVQRKVRAVPVKAGSSCISMDSSALPQYSSLKEGAARGRQRVKRLPSDSEGPILAGLSSEMNSF